MKNRQIDMLKAAMPYTAPHLRKPMQVYIQANELVDYIHSEENENELEACDTGSVGDIEGMMEHIRPFCNKRECELVDMVLNFFRAQKMYQCYRNYSSVNGKSCTGGGMFEFLMSQLSPEQRSMFDKMSSSMDV